MTQNLRETELTLSVKGTKPITTNAGVFLRDVFTATDDIVAKAANGAREVNISKMQGEVDKIIKSTKRLKIAKTVLPFITVLAFLLTLPKFVVWMTKKITGKEEFPGLAGLSDDTKDSENKAPAATTPVAQPPPVQKVQSPVVQPAPVPVNINYSTQTTTTPIRRSTGWKEFLRRYNAR